jgi:hypothetical protein
MQIATMVLHFCLLLCRNEACAFLLAQSWCRAVRVLTLKKWIEGVLALLYAEIEPEPQSGAAEAVWVVVGDLPPAYFDAALPSLFARSRATDLALCGDDSVTNSVFARFVGQFMKKSIIEHHIGITVHLEWGVWVRVGSQDRALPCRRPRV